jgi:phospholipase C
VTLAKANTFPIGFYSNRHHDGRRKDNPDLPVTGALAARSSTLQRWL